MLGAQPVERAGRADALEGRVQPEGGQDRGVDRWSAGGTLGRSDPLVQGFDIEALDERPHQAGPVVGRQETLEIDRPQLDLGAVRALDPGRTAGLGGWLGWLRLREVEQRLVHVGIVAAPLQPGNPPRPICSQPRDATFGADEPANPSGWTRQEPANLVRRLNTRG